MAVNRAQVLIVGVPGRMYESLRTLLKAVPDLDVLGTEDSGWPFAELNGARPDLVLLDFNRPAEVTMRDLAWVRSAWPAAGCLALADTARQLQTAKAAGADRVLLRGFAIAEFLSVVRDLLEGKVWLAIEPPLPGGEGLESSVSPAKEQALLASPVVF